jgi:ABC-2 type transport system ATP-binding protein
MKTLVEARNLIKTYKRRDGSEVQAVKGVDLDIQKGEIFSLLGPNGAGKTTTISMISGLIEPTQGDARIGGHSITDEPMKAKKLMGVVPQEIALYPALNARQNLEFFGRMYDITGKELARRVDEVLEFIDLKDRQKDRIDTFSGGMKRRVNIGVGLLHRPQLVYMDEPTVGIDPQNRRRILDTVFRLRDEYDMTVLYTTHLMEEAQELSDRVGIIDHGEIIALGTQAELTRQVGEEDRLFIGVGDQTIDDDVLETIKQSIPNIRSVEFEIMQAETPVEDAGEEMAVTATGTMSAVRLSEGVLHIVVLDGRKVLSSVINLLDDYGVQIQSIEVREPDLEAVFLSLTGRALRD